MPAPATQPAPRNPTIPPTSAALANVTLPGSVALVPAFIAIAWRRFLTDAIVPVPAGEIVEYGGSSTTIPNGWLACDGSSVSRSTYVDLFAAIGVRWGAGSEINSFNLPNLPGTTVAGVSTTKVIKI